LDRRTIGYTGLLGPHFRGNLSVKLGPSSR